MPNYFGTEIKPTTQHAASGEEEKPSFLQVLLGVDVVQAALGGMENKGVYPAI